MTTARTEPDRKSYEQVCPMATALDLVGDRWTILILRELLGGPARFHELRDGLPGIASNLLTGRLRRLEVDGIVRRIHSHSTVLYRLTEQGAGIRDALEELGKWGARMGHVGPPLHARSIRAVAMALQPVLARAGEALPETPLVIELEVAGELAEIVLGQRPRVTARPAVEPVARIRASTPGVSAVLMGQPIEEAAFTHVSGDKAATRHLIAALR
jgi:DNA-binding HxlR family transcriptional regulator